jgi:hypothetical protein
MVKRISDRFGLWIATKRGTLVQNVHNSKSISQNVKHLLHERPPIFFEYRLDQLHSPKGEKTGIVLQAIDRTSGNFSIAELQNECPNVSVDMIRRVLKNLRAKNRVECLGRGQNAQWRKTSKWQLGNTQ